LYEEGKVCLSLLNTWTGRGNEVWDPKSSSILQVLVSLQGLVLNSKPYFNEAGYDKQTGTAEGEKNSLSYNENTFLLNCKTMMYLIRKPPKVIMNKFRKILLFLLVLQSIFDCYVPDEFSRISKCSSKNTLRDVVVTSLRLVMHI
jgi:ubiquitin-conjugating enzyme E2 O